MTTVLLLIIRFSETLLDVTGNTLTVNVKLANVRVSALFFSSSFVNEWCHVHKYIEARFTRVILKIILKYCFKIFEHLINILLLLPDLVNPCPVLCCGSKELLIPGTSSATVAVVPWYTLYVEIENETKKDFLE